MYVPLDKVEIDPSFDLDSFKARLIAAMAAVASSGSSDHRAYLIARAIKDDLDSLTNASTGLIDLTLIGSRLLLDTIKTSSFKSVSAYLADARKGLEGSPELRNVVKALGSIQLKILNRVVKHRRTPFNFENGINGSISVCLSEPNTLTARVALSTIPDFGDIDVAAKVKAEADRVTKDVEFFTLFEFASISVDIDNALLEVKSFAEDELGDIVKSEWSRIKAKSGLNDDALNYVLKYGAA